MKLVDHVRRLRSHLAFAVGAAFVAVAWARRSGQPGGDALLQSPAIGLLWVVSLIVGSLLGAVKAGPYSLCLGAMYAPLGTALGWEIVTADERDGLWGVAVVMVLAMWATSLLFARAMEKLCAARRSRHR